MSGRGRVRIDLSAAPRLRGLERSRHSLDDLLIEFFIISLCQLDLQNWFRRGYSAVLPVQVFHLVNACVQLE